VSHDRPEDDRFAFYLGSLFGIAPEEFRKRDRVPDSFKLYFAGFLANSVRHPEGLTKLIAAFFGLPVEIREFVGQWLDLPAPQRLRLGESPATGSLGRSAIAGARIWDSQLKFRIRFGPLTFADFHRLLPDGGSDSTAKLVDLVRNYVGDEFCWDVNLVLDRKEVPPIKLGGFARLGWTTWLAAKPFDRDPDELLLDPLASL
jgi:type VI secretion system protein ImpH